MNFSSYKNVGSVISTMKTAEIPRASNRSILNGFMNGEPPWSQKEAADNGIILNFNDKSGANLLHMARNQYENAFSKTGQFFKVTIPDAPVDKQGDYGAEITANLNHVLTNSRPYYYTRDSVWGGLVLHGSGARMWWDEWDWKPSFAGIQDILIPTDTDLTMENLPYFAVRRGMRPGALYKKTIARGKNVDKGWDLPQVKKLLDTFKDLNTNPRNFDWSNNPEQMAELYKQNAGYYDSDAAPMIWFWDFYHLEEEHKEANKNGWYRKMILDEDCKPITSDNTESPEFIYKSEKPFASKLDNIIHFQFGDGNNVPPFKYHSIRSLAWLVYDLLWVMNRLNCQFTQHVFEQMMLLFRIQDPADREKLQKLVLSGIVGVLPDGLNMVTAQERYQVNTDLVQGLMGNLKQKVGEASSGYTQQIDNNTKKERTAYEVQAVLAQASALMSSMLGRAYRQEHFACLEICRRFTLKNSPNFDVKKFQQKCKDAGVPDKWMDSSRWSVEVEQVSGGGNRTLGLAIATEMMNRINLFDPAAQAEIKHDFLLELTDNPKKAARLAPLDAAPKVSDSAHDAELAFATLMMGVNMNPQEGINHIEQVETLLRMLDEKIQGVEQSGGVGTPEDIAGFQAVATYISKHIQLIAQDEKEKPRVKAYQDALGGMLNKVKAFVQRQAEQARAAQEASQVDPEAQAKAAATTMLAQTKAQISEATAAQKMEQKQAAFEQKMQQDIQKHQASLTKQFEQMKADLQTHQLELQTEMEKASTDVTAKGMKTGAEISLMKKKAAAAPKPDSSSKD